MSAGVVRIRALAVSVAVALPVLLLALPSCREPTMGPVGVSTQRRGETLRAPVVDAGTGAPSPVAADFRQRMARVMDRAVSRGHAERFDGIVWANEAARAAWDGTADMPDGAMLVEEAIERTPKGDRAAGLLVMEKRDGAWHFTVVDAGGRIAADAREAACAACHHEAPRDGVFRLR